MSNEQIKVLDHGYVRLVEAWGHGDAGPITTHALLNNQSDYECGIIEAARQSTQGSFRGWDQDEKLLSFLYNNKHATPFEFSGMVVEVQAPIFVFREWHRHRTQSYNEMSARYAPLPDLNYIPTVERCLSSSQKNKQAGTIPNADGLDEYVAAVFQEELRDLYREQQEAYERWLQKGVPKELARVVLPVGRYSKMRASTNLRNWLGFLTLRMDPLAQYETRMYAEAVASIIEKTFPRTWKLFQLARTTNT